KKEGPSTILGRDVYIHDMYDIRFREGSNSEYFKIHKYNQSVQVLAVVIEQYEGSVYNLEVMQDSSYTINSRPVHNCNWTSNSQGFYYLSYIEQAEKENRITNVPFDHSAPVETWWDIGVGDNTVIWFTQTMGKVVNVIDYYKNNNKGLGHYAKILQGKPYVYRSHNFPHDMANTEFGTGRTRYEMAEELFKGTRLNTIQKLSIEDGINAARIVLPSCYFDRSRCLDGLDALRNYHKQFDERLQEYKDKPVHDWSSDPADAFRYMAIGITLPKSRSFKNEFMKRTAKTMSTRSWQTS
ncbi:MAG: hypothetical protein DRQ39_10170, partial [Gammaproteobacteria bacterium]